MIEAAARQLAEALASRGIDPAPFLSDGVEAARIVAGGDEAGALEILQLLDHFARQVADRGLTLWTPFRYGVRALAPLAPDDPIGFGSLLSELSHLIGAMSDRGLEVELCLQQGVPAAAHQRAMGAELVGPLLRTAARMAARGQDPKEMLRHGVPAFEVAAAGDASKLAVILDAVESFALALEENGVGPHWPIFTGVAAIGAAIGAATPGDAHAFVAALKELASLIASLVAAGVSPYPTVEYGVTAAFQAAAHAPWLLPEVLPMAAAIAVGGSDPLRALQALGPVAGMAEPLGLALLGVAESAAAEGIDPAPALQFFAPLLAEVDLEQAGRSMTEACALLGVLAEHDIRPLLAFDEGFGQLHGATTALVEQTLRIASLVAAQGRDPGPAIKFGIVAAVAQLESVLLDAMLDAAERLSADAIDPWALLEWGTPAIASIDGDEADRPDLLARLDALVRALHELGADARTILLYTVHQPSRALKHERARVVALVDRIAGAIAAMNRSGIDPRAAMVHGIPKVADAAPHALEAAFRAIESLAERRIDPAPFLVAAIPALAKSAALDEVLARALAALDALRSLGVTDASRLANAIEAIGGEDALLPALDAVARSAALGFDASTALAAMVPERGEPFDAWLAQAERSLLDARRAGIDLGREQLGLTSVARAGRRSPDALAMVMSAWIRGATTVRPELLPWGTLAAADVAGEDPAQFDRILQAFGEGTAQAEGEVEAVFRASMGTIAAMSGGTPERFVPLLDALVRLASSPGPPLKDLLEAALPLAHVAAGDQPESFLANLEDLIRLRTTRALGESEGAVLYILHVLRELVGREPSVWRDLIVPTLHSQGAAARQLLLIYWRIAQWIDGAEAIALLRTVVTQEGVRAELVAGFLYESLKSGAIQSLGAEREVILSFLRAIPIPHPEYYRHYRVIAGDHRTTSAQKREQIESLHADAAAIGGAIVQGEIPEGLDRNPLFAETLFFVFPPAITLTQNDYASLYRALADHPEHTSQHAAPEHVLAQVPIGSFRAREGEQIELAAWEPLAEAVASVHAGAAEALDLEALGRALLDAWIDGKIAQADTKRRLLAGLYRQHQTTRHELSEDLGDAGHLVAYCEFLSDTAKEIIQDALRAVCVAEPDSYHERVIGKLSRRARVGRGLVRTVWRTIAAHREGSIDAGEAIARLGRQLNGFDLGDEALQLRLLATDEDELTELLEGLERNAPSVDLGDEHLRVLNDLTGPELAAMRRELFGGEGRVAKLEYCRGPGGRTMALRFVVTKRKAHAVIGFCEGACTASDQQLWDDPRFLQVVIWGPDQRAHGGVHLFLIEEEDGRRCLALPGINPSLGLLAEVGAEAVLDAILGFARNLMVQWALSSVLIPTHGDIATNRGSIRQIIVARGYPIRAVGPVQFSYQPHAYTIDSAYVVE